MRDNVVFKRKLEDKINKFLYRREIIGIRGARQVGKTTLLKIIFNKIDGEKVFMNLDLPDMRRALAENPIDLVKRYKKNGKKLFLFMDEIQRVKNAGESLKIIYDEFPDVKILFSGSSSLEIKTNILPFLVGRLFLFELYSFDFEEFLMVKDESLAKIFREKNRTLRKFLEGKDEIAPPTFENEFLNYWKEYAVFGGYPEVIKTDDLEEKITILKNIYALYLEKDVVAHFGIEETTKFEDLLKFLAFRTSSILSVSTMASDLNISFRKAEEYINVLRHTYVIHLLRPFHRNLVTELRKASKIYFSDMGLRNAVINNFMSFDTRPDRGVLIENFVFRELLTGFEECTINYWRTTGKAEVDFILRKGEDYIAPIEVKLSRTKLGKSFYSFLKFYKPEKALVITLNEFGKEIREGCTIYRVPVYYL